MCSGHVWQRRVDAEAKRACRQADDGQRQVDEAAVRAQVHRIRAPREPRETGGSDAEGAEGRRLGERGPFDFRQAVRLGDNAGLQVDEGAPNAPLLQSVAAEA